MINVVSQYLVKLDKKAGDGSVNEGPADPHGRQWELTLTNGFLIGHCGTGSPRTGTHTQINKHEQN